MIKHLLTKSQQLILANALGFYLESLSAESAEYPVSYFEDVRALLDIIVSKEVA